MQNNLPPLCDAERRFFVCSAPTGPGLQISGLRRFRCIVRPFRRHTAIRLFRRSAAGDIHGEIKAGQVGIGRVQAVVRGTDADVARSDVQRRGLQPLIAIRDRDRRPVRALRADLERVVAVDRVVCGGNGQIAAFDRQQLCGLQSLFFCDGAYQHMK